MNQEEIIQIKKRELNNYTIKKVINNHLAYELSLIPDYKVINITYGKDYLNECNVFKMRQF